MKVAIGLKARTGRAILVAIGGPLEAPQLALRCELRLMPAGAVAP